jgi:serine/threonine protein phosphatase PrpC
MHYEIGQANRLGNRNKNQDRFAAIETEAGVLLVLADGLGGSHKGEVAAETLVEVAREAFRSVDEPIADQTAFLRGIIYETHAVLLDMTPDGSIPGTTGVLCLVQDGAAQWVHVGDSRLYLFRHGKLLFRTRDHSYVEALYQQGAISEADKAVHPRRNQITQCIGCNPQRPQVSAGKPTPLEPGDVILLCSDGLWDAVDAELMAEFTGRETLDGSLQELADVAERNAYPRSDNISVVALRYHGRETQRRPIRLAAGQQPPAAKLQEAIDAIEKAWIEYEDEIQR